MKGGGAVPSAAAKKRWKGLLLIVLALVFLSMLVPLALLLRQHDTFRSTIAAAGYGGGTQRKNSSPNRVRVYEQHTDAADAAARNESKDHQSAHIDNIVRRLAPPLPKESGDSNGSKNITTGLPVPGDLPKQVTMDTGVLARNSARKGMVSADENDISCELKFGSYCLWHREHREKMEDSVVKMMKDLLFVARAYYPSIAKIPAQDKLSHEMKQNIQDFERVLGETTTDKDLPPQNEKRIVKMEAVVAKAKSCHVECNNVDKKFRQLVDLTEDEANFHMKQSAFLYKLAVQTMPKSLHCLSMRLTVEYFKSSLDTEKTLLEKFVNPNLHHYIIFSKNILASSVVINSTVAHAKKSEKQVFHVVTDRENYFAMKLWFTVNKYGDAAVQVLDIEDAKLYNNAKVAPLHLSLPEEFRVSLHKVDKVSSTIESRMDYLSMFSHSHYVVPKLFQALEKVVVLDDDVIVQRDLSFLWNLDMGGKVNGAMQFCSLKLFDLKNYHSSSIIVEDSCAWTTGVNIIDLSRWRRLDLTEKYQKLVHEMTRDGGSSSETVALRASLLTFQGLIYALEDSWVVSGLGHNYGVDQEAIKMAAVLHFDGSMKPWLDLGISMYKSLWRKFLNKQNQYFSDCNVIQ